MVVNLAKFWFVIWVACSSSVTAQGNKVQLEEASKALISGDRVAAIQTLRTALTEETRAPAKKEIQTRIYRAHRAFMTDRAQRLYEVGQAIWFNRPDLAVEKWQQALGLEPDNLSVISRMVRHHLHGRQCETAQSVLDRQPRPLDEDPEVYLLRKEILFCSRKYLEVIEVKVEHIPPELELAFLYVEAKAHFELKNLERTQVIIQKIWEKDPKFPENLLLKARLKKGESAESAYEWELKYLSQCKELHDRDRRRYIFEPHICQQAKTVQESHALEQQERSTST